MPGILGIPTIPTTRELEAAGVALEDHAAAQMVALIDHARIELVTPVLVSMGELQSSLALQTGAVVFQAKRFLDLVEPLLKAGIVGTLKPSSGG